MEIRLCYIYFSCYVFLVSYLEAKSVSLNDIIAAEEQAAQQSTTRRAAQLYSAAGTSGSDRTGTFGPKTLAKKRPLPSKYRQAFRIESPAKPRKYKTLQKIRHQRNNFNKKRETNHNDGIIQKYIPLLKNIRMLVDNILTTESGETFEPRESKFKRNLFTANERDEVVCTCDRRPNSESTAHPQEETITSTPAVSAEVQKEITSIIATTAQTLTTVDDNVGSVRRYKDVPLLPTRNSSSIRRNDSGFGQRSSSPLDGSFEGHITRNNGDNERDTGKSTGSYTENYEEYTDGHTRNDAGSDRSTERARPLGVQSRDRQLDRGTIKTKEPTLPRSETFEDVTRNLPEHEREIEYQVRRDETESSLSVPELDSRLRRLDSQEEGTTIRSTEISKEGFTDNSTSDKRVSDRNGSLTTENQEVSAANEAIAPQHILPNSTYPVGKVVMIFDGYSVAKDVNGANRLTEKAIQIHN